MSTTKRYAADKSKTLGVRLPLDELALIESAAANAGQKPGVWAREVLLKSAAPGKPEWLGAPCPGCGKPIEVVVIGPEGTTCMECWQRNEKPACPDCGLKTDDPAVMFSHCCQGGSWSDEWTALERMEPAAAMERLNELRAGRELPDGFRSWSRAEKIAWLDREWPL